MPIEMVLNSRVPVKVWTDRIEPEAIVQLKNTASLPVVHPHVAAMPDVHLGKGATVGAVVPTKGAICPAAVGVDIGAGCPPARALHPRGPARHRLPEKLRHSIEREIPSAGAAPATVRGRHGVDARNGRRGTRLSRSSNGALHQLGTLGGGNHFIEVCVDRGVRAPLGSSTPGAATSRKTVAETHIARAKRALGNALGDLPTRTSRGSPRGPGFDAYAPPTSTGARDTPGKSAIMMSPPLRQIAFALGFEGDVARLGITTEVDCHHNYVSREHFG